MIADATPITADETQMRELPVPRNEKVFVSKLLMPLSAAIGVASAVIGVQAL